MRSYHVDVEFKFTVPAYSEEEARSVVKEGFAKGEYVPENNEIMVNGFVGKDSE